MLRLSLLSSLQREKAARPLMSVAAAVVLVASQRGYFWPYAENLVPEGVKPSSFQASPVPSVRENIIQEYALGPLFGARTPLCLLGFLPPPAAEADGTPNTIHGRAQAVALIEKKKALRVALAELLSCEVKDIELGHITMAKEMMLYRPHTPESPKLADGPGASGQSKQRRLSRYARRPVAARAFMDVYVPDSMFESLEERRNFATFVQDRLAHYESEASSFDETRAAFEAKKGTDGPHEPTPSSSATAAESVTRPRLTAQQREAFETDMEERARVLDSVADLLELGVVYCEVPAKEEDVDGHDYHYDRLHGKELDLETAERVLDRWDARLQV